jgi:hypothetical protein
VQAKTIGNYGGPYVDQDAVENPESEMAADEGNRLLEDTAQMTVACVRVTLNFLTSAAAPPLDLPAATVEHDAVWGSGSSSAPTVRKTATGRYTITFPTPLTDSLSVSENVSFRRGDAGAMSADPLDDCKAELLTIAANVVTLKTEAPQATLADVGDNSGNPFEVTVWLR